MNFFYKNKKPLKKYEKLKTFKKWQKCKKTFLHLWFSPSYTVSGRRHTTLLYVCNKKPSCR